MHEKDRALIQSIQDFFGGIGSVSKPNNTSMVEFRVSALKDIINIVIPHFDNYPPSPEVVGGGASLRSEGGPRRKKKKYIYIFFRPAAYARLSSATEVY
jgi:hypothetical protein